MQKIVKSYSDIRIGVLGSHSALEVMDGAKDENLNNLYEQLLNDKLLNVINEFAVNKISEKSTSDLRKEK